MNKTYVWRTVIDEYTCAECSKRNDLIMNQKEAESNGPPLHGKDSNHLTPCRCRLEEMKTTLVNLRYSRRSECVPIDRRTIFGNPYLISSRRTREESIAKFRVYFEARMKRDVVFRAAVKALKSHKLGCWCTPLACHGDVIIEYLENLE